MDIRNAFSEKRFPSAYIKKGVWDVDFSDYKFSNQSLSVRNKDFLNKIKENYDKIIEMFYNDDYNGISDIESYKDNCVSNNNNYGVLDIEPSMENIYDYKKYDDEFDKIIFNRGKLHASENLMSYCVVNDDMKILQMLISKNILTCYPSLVRCYIIENNNEKMFKIIMDSVTFEEETINEFFREIVNGKHNIYLLNILHEKGYKMRDNLLLNAIAFHNVEVVKYFIDNNYDVQTIFDSMETVSIKYNVEIIKLLHNHINILKFVDNIMIDSSVNGCLPIVMYLTESFPEVKLDSALMCACRANKIDVIKYLLEKGTDITMIDNKTIMNCNIEVLKLLINYNIHVDKTLLSPQLLTCFVNDTDFENVNYLLGQGADITLMFEYDKNEKVYSLERKNSAIYMCRYEYLNSPLEYIVSVGKMTHIKFLVDNHYDLFQPEINRLFIVACANGQCDTAKYLYALGAELNNESLKAACFFGHYDIVLYVMSSGLELTNVDQLLGNCLFSYHSRCRSSPTYDDLIKDGTIYKNDVYNYGKGCVDICKLLFKHGVKMSDDNFIPLFLKEFFDVELFTYFVGQLPDINKKYNFYHDTQTLLEASIMNDAIEVTELLLKLGAKPYTDDTNIFMALKEEGKFRDLLLSYGYED
jgi:ankyrin repeat protein